jgi:hypothetical protein
VLAGELPAVAAADRILAAYDARPGADVDPGDDAQPHAPVN